MSTPSTLTVITTSSVNWTVTESDDQNSGDETMVAKFSRPMKRKTLGRFRLYLCRLIHAE